MLKYNEVNPLAVFGMRRIEHCPPHFSPLRLDLRTSEKRLLDWIWENLSGRFYFGTEYASTKQNAIHSQLLIAFEEPGEASYFSLILDTLNTHSFDF